MNVAMMRMVMMMMMMMMRRRRRMMMMMKRRRRRREEEAQLGEQGAALTRSRAAKLLIWSNSKRNRKKQ